MSRKILVHTTPEVAKRIRMAVGQERTSDGYGLMTKFESAEFAGQLEVWVDVERLVREYAAVAFSNKNHRFVRGPVEVRAVGMREVPGTRRDTY